MSIYGNKTNIYPDLNPLAPQEPKTYWLKKLTETEAYLLNEIEVHEQTAKKMKWFSTTTSIMDTGLITSMVITGGISIAAFASRVGLPIGINLSGTSLLFSIATVIKWKSFKTFTIKQEKHDSIKLLAQSKLDSIANIISQTMQDGDKTDHEKTAGRITGTRKKEGKYDFLQKIAHFRYTGCQCHLKYEAPPPYMWFYNLQRL